MMEVIRLIYEDSIKLLKRQGVEFETGLTIEEITKIEDIYTIKFPKSLKEFLMMTLPISKGFLIGEILTKIMLCLSRKL